MGPTAPGPRSSGDPTSGIVAGINAALWAASHGGRLGPGIALMSGTQALSGAPMGTKLLGPDKIHPNALGNRLLARNIRARIDALGF